MPSNVEDAQADRVGVVDAGEARRPGSSLGETDPDAVARFVLSTPSGVLRSLVGLSPEELRARIDSTPLEGSGRLALIAPVHEFAPAERVIEWVIEALVDTAARMWPYWHGRRETGFTAAEQCPVESATLSRRWIRLADQRILRGRRPRPPGFPLEIELAQLGLAIHPQGLALVVTPSRTPEPREVIALLHALEWIAHHAGFAVVLALPSEPPRNPAYDRALSAAMFAAPTQEASPLQTPEPPAVAMLAPIRGEPHPLSAVEQRVAAALRADAELAALFAFNRVVRTSRGSTPRVDLLWESGRIVVELDGYSDHGSREAFARDRHRDYELTLSGYSVLRISNDEVLEDVEKAIEKIRDIVRARAARRTGAGR